MPPEPRAEHWDEFEAMIDLHKFYFDQILKAAGFALATIAALTTYIVKTMVLPSHGSDPASILLVLPFLFSAATAAVFWVGARKAREFAADVDHLKSEWGFQWRPHTELLGWMSLIFSVIFSLLAMGMAGYWLRL